MIKVFLAVLFIIHFVAFAVNAEEVALAETTTNAVTTTESTQHQSLNQNQKEKNGATEHASANQNLSESEIPLQLDKPKVAESQAGSLFKALFGIAIVGILATVAYMMIKKHSIKNAKNPHTQIKVLTQHYLGPKKSLAIVRVAGESILIGVTDQNINMIKSLSLLDEDIPEDVPTVFEKVLSKSQAKDLDIQEDDFSFTGIKDLVSSKLKNMRSLD